MRKRVVAFTTKRILKWVGLTLLIAVGISAVLAGIGAILYFAGPTIGKWLLGQLGGLVLGMLIMAAVFITVMIVLEHRTKKERTIEESSEESAKVMRRMPASKHSTEAEKVAVGE